MAQGSDRTLYKSLPINAEGKLKRKDTGKAVIKNDNDSTDWRIKNFLVKLMFSQIINFVKVSRFIVMVWKEDWFF